VDVPRPTAPRVDAAQRDARALELRAAGATYRQIAAVLHVSLATAHKCVDRGLDRTRREPADRLRKLELERLDGLQRQAVNVLRARHIVIQAGKPVIDEETGRPYTDHTPTLNAIRTLLAVQERRAKLLGLDAPTKLDVNLALAWERAGEEERLEVMRLADVALISRTIAEIEAELERRGPPTPPAAETIPPAAEPDPDALAAAVEAALDAAGVPLQQREAAYQAVERRLREQTP
jgi:hypothetical protein